MRWRLTVQAFFIAGLRHVLQAMHLGVATRAVSGASLPALGPAQADVMVDYIPAIALQPYMHSTPPTSPTSFSSPDLPV